MDRTKDVVFTDEFVRKFFHREIFYAFENLNEFKDCVKNAIRTGCIMPHPEKGQTHYWCLLKSDRAGLVKIPLEETKGSIVAITVAHPVTDPRCEESYKRFSSSQEKVNNTRGE